MCIFLFNAWTLLVHLVKNVTHFRSVSRVVPGGERSPFALRVRSEIEPDPPPEMA